MLRDKLGKFHKFTLRNVVLLPEASRDIIGTGRLEKVGRWLHIRYKELYHQDDRLRLPKFPFYNTKKRLKVIPSVRLPPTNDNLTSNMTISKDIANMMDTIAKDGLHNAIVNTANTSMDKFSYSLWYGGNGDFAHAAGKQGCVSYFDSDKHCSEAFQSRQSDAYTRGALEHILADPQEFVEHTKDMNYNIHVSPPCTSYTQGGSNSDFGQKMANKC